MATSNNNLSTLLAQTQEEEDCSAKDLTVLAPANDPFRVGTSSGHRDGAWFAQRVEELDLGEGTIYLRGAHYAWIGKTKPNGLPYTNTDADWSWLGMAAKAARWLGYVGFDQIHDQRNAAPVIRKCSVEKLEPYLNVGIEVEIPETLKPTVGIAGFSGTQAFKLVIVGEKSSLEPVLGPVAESRKADLYLPTGEISDTLIHVMAKDGAADGRRVVIFYFSDCDPSGWQMPVSLARKLQAFKVAMFPELEFEVHRVALRPDQVREYGLPSTPMKAKEKRADKWTRLMGVEQTEVDAIATLQPELLKRLARKAIAPFYDTTLDARVKEARDDWLEKAMTVVSDQLPDDLSGIEAEASVALEEMQERIDEINEALKVSIPDGVEFPQAVVPEPILTVERNGTLLLDSDWTFADQCARLKASKRYATEES